MIKPEFKSKLGRSYDDRLEREFYEELDPRMRAVKLEQADWMWRAHRVQMIITCIIRTAEENKKVGGSPTSAHKDFRATDERTRHLSDQVIISIQKHLKSTWRDFLYVVHHDSGAGDHLHTNIRYKYRITQTDRRNV